MRKWQPELNLDFRGPVYLSLDMDVLDPAFAPGVSHHEPGGPSTRDVLQLIHSLRVPITGADIVEFNPERDPLGITAMAAAKFLKEIAACMLESN
jgi:arginase family enzyme